MSLFCWGSTINGELGLGGIEEEQISAPRELKWSNSADVETIACGPTHTLLLTKEGQLFSCGNNDYGQLGHELPRKRPQLIKQLENHVTTDIACGTAHSMAINEWGQLFTWGSNSFGQLGHETFDSYLPVPKLVKFLATKHVVQIACGYHHCLALTNSGEVYSWGLNNYGQLGIGHICEKISKPTLVSSIAGIPIAFLACGGNHSFVVSKSGAVFGWGKNIFGQLGVSDEQSRFYPTQLKTLRSIGVKYITAGEDFSAFLTSDGGVFTCGSGNFGQLGHGVVTKEVLPRMVIELMGTTCTQIACGNRHTLTFVPSRGRIYGFGLGGSGQLGSRTIRNSSLPQVVLGPWASPTGTTLLDDDPDEIAYPVSVKRIFSGGDHSFVTAVRQIDGASSYDCRLYEPRTQISSISISLAEQCTQITKDETVDLDFMSVIETIFKSLPCINASFLTNNDEHQCCNMRNPGVNLEEAEKAFEFIRKMENESLKHVIWEGVTNNLLKSLSSSPADVEALRIYLILPIYHEFINSKNYLVLHTPFSRAVLTLSKVPLNILMVWWSNQSNEYFERIVENYKNVIIHIMSYNSQKCANNLPIIVYEPNLEMALQTLALLFRINHTQRTNRIPYEQFYVPELLEYVDLQQDYLRWIENKQSTGFYLCNYPFLFDAKAKTLLLQIDQAIQMQNAMSQASANGLLSFFTPTRQQDAQQYVVFNVTRDHLVEDTLREICMYRPQDLKKPLKVKFHGEEAEDAGGVRKEFFMLLIKDLVDPKYGMFKEFEESRFMWFSEHSFEEEDMFKLIGTICGLAIYNFTIINLPFPLVLYKKLLKEPVGTYDLKELAPTLANSMQSILDYENDDFEVIFNLTFEVSREVFGEVQSIALKQNGDKIAVTQQNKKEFVELYTDYVLNKSVERQFNGFYTGFMKVCGGRVMELFKAHELMAVVIGNEDYDWNALEQNAQYKDGYSSGDQTIQWFWEVFHELTPEDKKKFLLFLTGSDRIPINGMKAIKIYIQPTTDNNFLPVAHTCFNLLDLPRYNTKEKLKYKLIQAIQQTHGFSLV